jgi:hypothetical protein
MLAKFVITFKSLALGFNHLFTETSNPTKMLSAVLVFQHYMNDLSSFVNLGTSSSFVLKFSSHISPRTILVGSMPRCLSLIWLCEATGDNLKKGSMTQRHYRTVSLLVRDRL